MSPKDSDKKQWSDPKDFGLPFVEITPLSPKLESVAEVTTLAEVEVGSLSTELVEQLEVEAVEEATPVSTEPSPAASKPSIASPAHPMSEEKSNTWVWVAVLIGLGIVALIVWQILANQNSVVSERTFEVVEQAAESTPSIAVDLPAETTVADQNQPIVNQDSIVSSTISNPNISKPAETGTTIANTASGNLIRIEQKGDRPQYFIIVGSLPNEAMALEQANEYLGKSSEVYLIAPFDGGKNYRLALAGFVSFKEAAAKLEEIKSQYTEELWILKY